MNYLSLVEVYQDLEGTTKRLEKTFYLSEFLKTLKHDEAEHLLLLISGKLFPDWDAREVGMASRLILKALGLATGFQQDKLEVVWKEKGDLGDTAEFLIAKKTQATLFTQELTTKKVFDNLRKLAEMEGEGTVDKKVQLVAELLTSAKPLEAKYILRTILGELRVGLGEGTVRDAIVWAFFGKQIGINYSKEENDLALSEEQRKEYERFSRLVQEAYDVANDYGIVVAKLYKGVDSLKEISLEPGRPMKVMLFQKAANIQEAFETVGKPAALENKYDGFRIQLHKKKGVIKVFTRRLEDVTTQFPDVVEAVKKQVNADSFILDAEVVGYDVITKKYLPFQSISQRIRRKYDIELMAQKYPVEVNVFDIMFLEGNTLINTPFEDRRKHLVNIIIPKQFVLKPAVEIITSDEKHAEEFYHKSLAEGNEGIMFKSLQAVYKPGSRVGYGLKLKPTMETMEVVIVGAEWGEGKRSDWLASFVIACRDPDTNNFLELGRVGTGFKEKEEEGVSFNQMTELLKPLIIEEKGKEVTVKPSLVIEVNYEEIQKSPTYKSGFALRFPRLVRLREDRSPDEINTIEDVREYYENQRGRNK